MAKCLMCNRVKGKRECQIVGGLICSLCCGTTRNENDCIGCEYYKSPLESRKYNKAPSYTPNDMEMSEKLQNISEYIESAFCTIDEHYKYELIDEIPRKILERLLDKYHFKDKKVVFNSVIVKKGFNYVEDVIIKHNLTADIDTLVKVIGAIHFVLVRRSKGKREYLKIIHIHVDDENGMRIISEGDI